MSIDFNSSDFLSLPKEQKRDIVISEFTQCRNDFEYYLDNYAYVRHPNAGIIQMEAFDFQRDVSIPIAETLRHKRSDASVEALAHYKYKFDYEKWWNKIAEKNIELSKVIPAEFHNFFKVTSKHEDFNKRVDTILLKSRQTGLSTIFQQLCIWHINFNRNVYDLVLSQTDREAIKFLNDLISGYDELPTPLKSRKLNANEHELWCSITGDKGKRSGIQALPPTTKAGRSYSPNLVILDEFAEYQHAEKVWTAISMSVSAGGIIVIIATPRGVGNLYHKIWEMTNKSLSVTIHNNPLAKQKSMPTSVFRPMTVHWSQLPHIEFKRRGFSSALSWYKHMCAKISMEKGEKAIAQELDLDFMSSGNTIDAKVIALLRNNCLENILNDIVVLDSEIQGLVIYEPPKNNVEYIIGIDTAEGVHSDYSVAIVFSIPKDEIHEGVLPKTVAKFTSNTHSVRQFTDIVRNIGIFFNEAWLNIERNNHGHVLLSYFIEDNEYNPDKILNKYDAVKAIFIKNVKGWDSKYATRTLLITTLLDFFTTYKEDLNIPFDLADELKTFIQKPGGKWEAQSSYHDDHVIAYGLALLGWRLLPKYKQFLAENSDTYSLAEIDDDIMIGSASLLDNEDNPIKEFINKQKIVKDQPLKNKKDVDIEKLKEKFNPEEVLAIRKKDKNVINHKYISKIIEYEDDDIGVF